MKSLLRPGGVLAIFFVCLLTGSPRGWSQATVPMVSLSLDGRSVTGMPLLWNPGGCCVLDTGGELHRFQIDESSDVQPFRDSFIPLSQVQMRERLQQEFGPGFTVSSTVNFLVVHRPQNNQWPEVLERLHREFLRYFGTRKTPLRQGRFPMVAIVLPDRASFLRYAQNDSTRRLPPNVLGYYSRISNRIAMYDHGQGAGGVDSTIRHEAAHQSAFNGGLHSRIATQPQWFIEGVGTMFEAVGIHDSSRNHSLASRVNMTMLMQLRHYFPTSQALTEAIDSLVGDDTMFSNNTDAAYAASWAMVFYLADRQPAAFNRFVATFTRRMPFIRYDASQRQQDFERNIGMSNAMLASQIHQFLKGVGTP